MWSLTTNQRLVSISHDYSGPIRGQSNCSHWFPTDGGILIIASSLTGSTLILTLLCKTDASTPGAFRLQISDGGCRVVVILRECDIESLGHNQDTHLARVMNKKTQQHRIAWILDGKYCVRVICDIYQYTLWPVVMYNNKKMSHSNISFELELTVFLIACGMFPGAFSLSWGHHSNHVCDKWGLRDICISLVKEDCVTNMSRAPSRCHTVTLLSRVSSSPSWHFTQ